MVTKLIQKGKLVFPDATRHKIYMSADMQDFISGLLVKEPTKRLGYKSRSDILDHPWFKNVNWESLKKKKIKAPYFPECT